MTKLLGVIGDPIAHSLSPLIHNGWLRDLGFNATYEALQVSEGAFDEALDTLSKRDALGFNVTLPHKTAALESASETSEAAAKIGAANTLSYIGGRKWRADNTDAPGFMAALGEFNPDTEQVILLGAGGSARAIVYALGQTSCRTRILNRTVEKAQYLSEELGSSNTAYGSINQYKEYIENASLVINTTSMGYGGHTLDLPLGSDRLFFDISYGKVAAPQLSEAKAKGWRIQDGLTMLVAQAAYSFELWFGVAPDQNAAHKRCLQALKAVS